MFASTAMPTMITRYSPVWAATFLFLSSVAMTSRPLSALERAECNHQCQAGHGQEEDHVARVDQTAHEAFHPSLETYEVEQVRDGSWQKIGHDAREPEHPQHEERQEERDRLTVRQ